MTASSLICSDHSHKLQKKWFFKISVFCSSVSGMFWGVGTTTTNLMLCNIPEERMPQMIYPFLCAFKLHITVHSLSTSRIEIKVLKCKLQTKKCGSIISEKTWIAEAADLWWSVQFRFSALGLKTECYLNGSTRTSLYIYKSLKPDPRQSQACDFH